jgi:hypothetical protein
VAVPCPADTPENLRTTAKHDTARLNVKLSQRVRFVAIWLGVNNQPQEQHLAQPPLPTQPRARPSTGRAASANTPAIVTPETLAALHQSTTECATYTSGAGQVTDTYTGVSL